MARQELTFASPYFNAPGFGGFAPGGWPLDEPQGMFFTNSISLKPRVNASPGNLSAYSGGFLLHTGHPNDGLARVLKANAAAWRQSKVPVCAHLIPENPDQTAEMVRMLEEWECAAAVEVSCPPNSSLEAMSAFWEAAAGELPVIAYLPLEGRDGSVIGRCRRAGVEAVCLGAPRGMLVDERGTLQSGRLYGPAIFPQMLAAVSRLKGRGLPIIAGGGVFRRPEAQALLKAGASAVQLDAVLWRPGGWMGEGRGS